MNIVFFGTSNVALPVLESVKEHHNVLAVVTAPDAAVGRRQDMQESPVSSLARDLQLHVLKPESVKGNAAFFEELKKLNADIFVVVSYGYLLPEGIINLPRLKTVNVHFSLLPKYRGASPIQYALLAGERETGTTIFLLDKEMDHGPVLAQLAVPVDFDDNYITLGDKLARVSAGLLVSTLAQYESGLIMPKEQNHSQATFTKIISKDDGKIDWQQPSLAIYNRFRAFYPWPGIWTSWRGQRLKITDCHPLDDHAGSENPGAVIEGGRVVCGEDSCLQITSLQLEGKREMDIREFLNGYRDFAGSALE
ncbi:MAG TPA: methionyl-tRNA formyltransferase [Patescibacteria group bacterium]|nr:methionyl-tRNA formyltransferase [Patescibacteria group bacterium]